MPTRLGTQSDELDTIMRMLVTTSFYFSDRPTGAARLASDLAHSFAQSGHEVWLVAQAINKNFPTYMQQNGLHVLRYFLDRLLLPDVLRVNKHVSAVKRLLKEYLPVPPDVIHGHDLLIHVAALDFYQGRGRFCYTIHSPAVEELPIAWRLQGLNGRLKLAFGPTIIRRLEQKVLTSSVRLGAESEFTVNLIRRHYSNDIADRIMVIPGWVDLQRFRPIKDVLATRQMLDWPTDRPVLFVLRRLEARMGIDSLLYAIHKVRQMGLNVYTVIGGTGSLAEPLKALRDRLNLETCISFMGRVADDILPLAYAACDVSVMPTAQLECFGIPLLESMACGRPVLATPVGAIPEIIRPFEPQWIARSATPADLADLIAAFLTNSLPTHSPERMRGYVEARYSPEIAYSRYAEWLGI